MSFIGRLWLKFLNREILQFWVPTCTMTGHHLAADLFDSGAQLGLLDPKRDLFLCKPACLHGMPFFHKVKIIPDFFTFDWYRFLGWGQGSTLTTY